MYAAFSDGIGKLREHFGLRVRGSKEISGNVHGPGYCPFEKFSPVEKTGFVQAVKGNVIPFDEPVDFFFWQVQEL
jgi:hypothetical protein